ncbi:MAG: tRNA uridine-5-carboxymethylaminomethyl(34) synthesis enzyme MnmG [Hydrotalea sp.]|nr:tRNA uridine-5-carboxymethylaminomethyl(34) synthesis enzyme MnmG [Hydrotalea sp.]
MGKSLKRLVIIGGGHAGTEAAAASARLLSAAGGAKSAVEVMLITGDPATIGEMSCNPAIGGLGKGHLVKEIDAMGGIMGRAIDRGGIQFRLLNQSRGPAVFGPRAQADRGLYRAAVQQLLAANKNLVIKKGQVKKIIFDAHNNVTGVGVGDGAGIAVIDCDAVVLTTGTFLRGMIYIGVDHQQSAGRWGEEAENTLSLSLEHLALKLGRLKTGTPPRLSKKTIDWDSLPQQLGDDQPEPFSFTNDTITQKQIACAISHTNSATHDIIRDNLGQSAMYGGVLSSKGPRYCPSIEDKVTRFADKTSHQVFLEPEGYDDDTVYPNGLSTSLPLAIQQQYINSMKGLERAKILRAGYTIEYDFIDPRQIDQALMVKGGNGGGGGLFLAGQINGTTGYEEAAAQGLVAGINAARYITEQPPVIFSRTTSYIGVMIDDLTRLGTAEPYRMFTARAEHRLFLRPDNADLRLTPLGVELGVVAGEQQKIFNDKMARAAIWRDKLQANPKSPKEWAAHGITLNQDGKRRAGFDLLAMVYQEQVKQTDSDGNGASNHGDDTIWQKLCGLYDGLATVDRRIIRTIMAESLYAGYRARYEQEIKNYARDQFVAIPAGIDYKNIAGLSAELAEKLAQAQPENLSAANQIQGMTPAGLHRLQSFLGQKIAQQTKPAKPA